ncbi:uncharacterized protein LOC62_03G004304 [Vanrija pseudolonga]|uniref:Uncharacterized protein n=1 Tax=Vanrija pseudolonga TaxID=143232 RepID=A0AAF1BK85_9TREE|nr:hypothetical protein LOC62_03G004304 [Vanrija pseudolonga]
MSTSASLSTSTSAIDPNNPPAPTFSGNATDRPYCYAAEANLTVFCCPFAGGKIDNDNGYCINAQADPWTACFQQVVSDNSTFYCTPSADSSASPRARAGIVAAVLWLAVAVLAAA